MSHLLHVAASFAHMTFVHTNTVTSRSKNFLLPENVPYTTYASRIDASVLSTVRIAR
jgi:hypothetical protein